MAEFTMWCGAFCKMVLHALKYPHATVVGLLVGEKKRGAANSYVLTDCVPVAHNCVHTATAIEAALCQVDFMCGERNPPLQILGLYHAEAVLGKCTPDPYIRRIADKIQSNQPDAVLLTIENDQLGMPGAEPCFTAYSYSAEQKNWEPKPKHKFVLENEENTLGTASVSIHTKLYREIVDFENHLDNLSLDFWNSRIDAKLSNIL